MDTSPPVQTSGSLPEVLVPWGIRKHLVGYVKLKKILFHDKHRIQFTLDIDYRQCITRIINEQLWGVSKEKMLETTAPE
jgi:hypothetical protein